MRLRPLSALLLSLALPVGSFAQEEEESPRAPAVEGSISVAGAPAFVEGDKAAFQERQQRSAHTSLGFEELRFLRESDKSSLKIESRLIPEERDYWLMGRWTLGDRVYLDFGYKKFRTYYDGSGKYFGPTDLFLPLADERLHVDRERLWLELGFTPKDLPRLRLRYERLARNGKKPSTSLGETTFTGGRGPRSIVPAFWALDETRDIVAAEASFASDACQWAGGLRYERTGMDDARQTRRNPGEPVSRATTTRDGTTSDLFSAHAFVERRVSEKLLASAAAMTSTLDTNLDGSRIYGPDYDPVFDPGFARVPLDLGLLSLSGGTRLKQYVGNLNAVYSLSEHLSLRPSVRYERRQTDDVSTYVQTTVLPGPALQQQGFAAQSRSAEDRFAERIELRYTGRPGWTFSLRGDWSQTWGDLSELRVDQATSLPELFRRSDYTRLLQKYTLAANWHPRPGLALSFEYYFKRRLNDYAQLPGAIPDEINHYPGFIRRHDFSTHDFNLRVSWRPASRLSFITRYDLQYSTNGMQGGEFAEVRSSRATAHIISQSATWTPVPRLYLTGSANLVYDQLATPATAIVLDSDNNYFNATLGAGYALSKRSDLYLDVSHYQANDFSDNSAISLPYGADQKSRTASLTWAVRATEKLTYTFKYTCATYRDRAAGGRNDFAANVLYAKVQYQF